MNICCHTGQSCHRFSLASGCDQNGLLRRIILKLVDLDQCLIRNIEISQFLCNLDDIHHASSLYDHLTVIFTCRIDDLLHTVYIWRKCCNDNSGIFMLCKNMIKCDTYRTLWLCKSWSLGIGTVWHQCQYAFLTDLCKSLQIDRITIYRCIIYFKVSCMHNNTGRWIDCQCCRILNTVVCLNKFNTKLSQIDRLSVSDNFSSCTAEQIVFRQLFLNDSHRKLCRIDRKIQFS